MIKKDTKEKECNCDCHKIPGISGGLKLECTKCNSVYLGDNRGFIHLKKKDTKSQVGINSKKDIKFKKGGYFKSEEVEPGVTVMEMDSKGFMKMFGKHMFDK